MDLTEWGNYHFYDKNTKAIVYKKNSKSEYHISLFDKYQKVVLKIGNKTLISFTDSLLDVNNLTSFERKIQDHKYIYENGKLIKIINCNIISI